MPTWGAQLQELNKLMREAQQNPPLPGAPSPFDKLRRKYLEALHAKTGRAVIVYATSWMETRPVPDTQALTINLGDLQGFMEAVSNITERNLDLLLTSPGGSPEAAEAIMDYLRTRFDHIRAIIPVAAMSAATMMALACDEIVMGTHSQLGPIDPQFTIYSPEGPRSAPGQAIIDQFDMAKEQCQDPKNIGAWMPLLRGLMPGLLAQCHHQRTLAEEVVSRELAVHMFAGDQQKAKDVAAWFANFSEFKSHGRRVNAQSAIDQGLNVARLEADQELQDLVLSVHHAVRHTFSQTGTLKLIENHHGRAYIESVMNVALNFQPAPQQVPIPPALGQGKAPQNRQQRRHPGR